MALLLTHPYVDWIFTFAATAVFTYTPLNTSKMSFIAVLLVLLIVSIPIHLYFDTPTNTNHYLGLGPLPDREQADQLDS